MDTERPHLSITLPRNFMFHYQDGQPPRTPEPEPQPEQLQPPPPPRQTLRVRRRRTTFVAEELNNAAEDRPIPSIEAPELHPEGSPYLPSPQPALDNAYLSPATSLPRMLSPPKTPVAQMRGLDNFDSPKNWSDMDMTSQSETSSRPTSSSGLSDSSVSSRGSYDSFGGSCTSPEEDMTDPFSFCSPQSKCQYPQLSSPLAINPSRQPSQPKPSKLKLRAIFTEDMDHHLWLTYTKYLHDPTVTPFKALPSTVPPNGVCHRVARMARKTWKGGRSSSALANVRATMQYSSRSGTPDTLRPPKSGSNTPVPSVSKPYPRFPTEKQCRKRLRELAKQESTFSAHYQRLLHHRSPSPFESSPGQTAQPQKLSSPFPQVTSSFSTRDMNVSLATSTAASMQSGNPLSQLAKDATPQPPQPTWSTPRTSTHQKSQSLHIGLGLGLGSMLGPSFQAMSQMTDTSMNQTNSRTWHATSKDTSRLGSPVRFHAPRPISKAFKRRALHNFEEQARARGNSFVDGIFGAPAASSHRRVRSRGFSLGDMVEGARRHPLSTNGPPELNPFANLGTSPQISNHASVEPEAQGKATIRLGSPFHSRPSNTFPRASTSSGFEPPTSFEQRFAEIPSEST